MNKKKYILFVSSSGGHFAQLMKLKSIFGEVEYKIITDEVPSIIPLLEEFNIEFLGKKSKGRGIGMVMNIFKYSIQAIRECLVNRPDFIITTGNYPSVPFCLAGKLFGAKIVYVLSFARVTTKSKSANIVYKFSDLFIVQWEEGLKNYPNAKYLGGGLY